MELRQYFGTVRRWFWLIALSTFVAIAASYIATRQQAPIFAAKTTVMVGRVIDDPNPNSGEIYLGQQLARTYAELAKRQKVRDATKDSLGLRALPQYSVSLVPNTQLLEIRVVDTNPDRAQIVANELANQLILQSPSTSEREQQDRRGFVTQQLQELEANIDGTNVKLAELQQQMAGMFSARQIADTQTQIAALEQKLNTYRDNYAKLLNFLEGGANTLTVVEAATRPVVPIGPNKGLTIILAAAAGLILAVLAAFLLDYLDDTVKSPDDVKNTLGLTTLGTVMRIEGESANDRLIAAHQPKSPIAEAYRVVRTNIQFSSLDNPPRTIMATSPNPGEGKSTTLANLGVVMAQQGQKVILVDTDLRRPTLHHIFKVANNTGLSNALLQPTPTVDGFVQETAIENLSVLSTGPLPPNPAELISSRRFGELIEDLKLHADVILFDSPPTLAVTDAAILARQVDGVVLVIDSSATRSQWAVTAKESLEKVGAKILGVVLNRLRPQAGGYYYYQNRYYVQDSEQGKSGKGGKVRLPRVPKRSTP